MKKEVFDDSQQSKTQNIVRPKPKGRAGARAVDRAPVNIFRNPSLPLSLSLCSAFFLSSTAGLDSLPLQLEHFLRLGSKGNCYFAMSLIENKRKRSWAQDTQATPEKDSVLELDLSPLPKVNDLTIQ